VASLRDFELNSTLCSETPQLVTDPDGRILGEYGATTSDVKAEYIWIQHGVDRIDVRAFGIASFAQVQSAFIQNGSTGAINLGGGDFIVLQNVTMNILTAADFVLA
jgi:hypothetical protein